MQAGLTRPAGCRGMARRMQSDEHLKLAEVEDRMWFFRSLHRHFVRALATEGIADDARVLDGGCGTGGLILRLRQARPAAHFVGVDLMPVACELARQRCGPAVEIRQANVMALPYEAGSFDVVVSSDLLCQIEDPRGAVVEMFRVLRPGGVVAINAPAYRWMWSYHDDAVQSTFRFTRPEIADFLRGAGFRDARLTHWNALAFPLIWARRKLFRGEAATSDVKLYPAPVEAAFNGIMALEHAWLRAGGTWAWGSSIFAVARKPTQ
jgi:ubiquinone/menaquinone biosynthesis C-methylase UbiE